MSPQCRRYLDCLQALPRAVVGDLLRPVGRLQVLSLDDKSALESWNATALEVPRERTAHELVEEQATRTPEAVAVVQGDRRMTDGELVADAKKLAGRLRAAGVKRERLVGLCVDRTPAMVSGLLGILEAGGAYVPLDPAYPADRLALMVEDSGMSVVVTTSDLRGEATGRCGPSHLPRRRSIG